MITVYGMKNCTTVRKATKWLDDHNIDYNSHDYKKSGVDIPFLKKAMDDHGWDVIINKNSTTWRTLPDHEKDEMTREQAELLADAKPSVIKRPIIDTDKSIIVGFNEDVYKDTLL